MYMVWPLSEDCKITILTMASVFGGGNDKRVYQNWRGQVDIPLRLCYSAKCSVHNGLVGDNV